MTRPRIDTDELRKLLGEVTPGKWRIIETLGSTCVLGGPRQVLRYAYSPDKENRANARLIALAPELADELIRLRAHAEAMAEALEGVNGLAEAYANIMPDRRGNYARAIDASAAALTAYRAATKETTDGK